MKLIINPKEYFEQEELAKFLEQEQGKKDKLSELTDLEFAKFKKASEHILDVPDSMRYFNELFDMGLGIAEKYGRKERTIILGAVTLLPILFGKRINSLSSYQDSSLRIYYDSTKPLTELLVMGLKQRDKKVGFAMRKAIGAQSQENVDVTDVAREGNVGIFRKQLARGPYVLRYNDNGNTEFVNYSSDWIKRSTDNESEKEKAE